MFDIDTLRAYCGTPPLPWELQARWNPDPWLFVGIAGLVAAWWMSGRRDRPGAQAMIAAAALMLLLFVSPLCALTSSLFSARALHHMLLIGAVAPLLAMAIPAPRLRIGGLSVLAILHALVLWIWHAPLPYALSLSGDLAYWTMQLSLLGSAWLLWRALLSPRHDAGRAVVASVATMLQMGLLGALLVFAARPLYEHHFTTTWPYGLSAMGDQQLGGLVMWVIALPPYLAVALWQVKRLLAAGGRLGERPGRRTPAG